jgi:membrane associated rhomboid family serine protease
MRIVAAVLAAWLCLLIETKLLEVPAAFAAVGATVVGCLVWLLARPRERSDTH